MVAAMVGSNAVVVVVVQAVAAITIAAVLSAVMVAAHQAMKRAADTDALYRNAIITNQLVE